MYVMLFAHAGVGCKTRASSDKNIVLDIYKLGY